MLQIVLNNNRNVRKRNSFYSSIKLLIVFCLSLSFLPCLMAQHTCGTVFTEEIKKDIRDKVEEGRNRFKKSSQMLVFKVQPFIMRRQDNLERAINPSLLSIKEAELNAAFADAGIQFDFCQHNYLTCNSTFNLETDSEFLNLLSYNTDNAIPVFFCNELGGGTSITGKAVPASLIAVSKIGAQDPAKESLVHEMGHYFGLDHTFHEIINADGSRTIVQPVLQSGTNRLFQFDNQFDNPVEDLEGINCHERADGFCGTPADYFLFNSENCDATKDYHEDLREVATWDNYYPPLDNFMSYYLCTETFAPVQNSWMEIFAANLHANSGFGCESAVTQNITPWFCGDEGDGGEFVCGGFCDVNTTEYFLTINCNAASIEPGAEIITHSNIRVHNISPNTVHNVDVIFKIIGQVTQEVHTVTIPIIEPHNYRDLESASIGLPNVPAGLYDVELRIVYNSTTYHICRTDEPIYISEFAEDPCLQTIIRSSPIGTNQTKTYKAGRYVEFRPGFIADSGNGVVMTAYIDPCSNAVQEDKEITEQIALTSTGAEIVNSISKTTPDQIILDTDFSGSFDVTNYPNPFSTKATIELTLNKADQVRISVSDINGKFLGDIQEQRLLSEGNYQFSVDGALYQPGIYYYTVIVGGEKETGKMILIK